MNKLTIILDSQPLDIDLTQCQFVSVARPKNVSVDLCVELNKGGALFPIAQIKLYNDDRYISAERTFESAKTLGERIANALNSSRL